MEDQRAWATEESLWTGLPAGYVGLIDKACLMVVPADPHILEADDAVHSMSDVLRWSGVDFTHGRLSRPEEGLIVLAYTAHARRNAGEGYVAHCTSTWRRKEQGDWKLVQHQQTPEANG